MNTPVAIGDIEDHTNAKFCLFLLPNHQLKPLKTANMDPSFIAPHYPALFRWNRVILRNLSRPPLRRRRRPPLNGSSPPPTPTTDMEDNNSK